MTPTGGYMVSTMPSSASQTVRGLVFEEKTRVAWPEVSEADKGASRCFQIVVVPTPKGHAGPRASRL